MPGTSFGRDGAESGPGAIVLGGDYVGLGIARSLGPRGIPVCVVDDEYCISRFSRYVRSTTRLPSISDGERTVEALLALEERLELTGWVLFPTRDETVATLSRHRQRLSASFRVPSPPWETFRWAWDKQRTYGLAERLGIPTPSTWYPTSADELEQVDCDPPFVIKPAIKPRFLKATKNKAWRADSRDELRELFRRAQIAAGGDQIMVQEMLPGWGERQFAYCTLFRDKQPLASMVAQRVRQHPMDFGRASTYVRTVDIPQLHDMSERLLSEIDYYGLVEIEYKLDRRTGLFKLLDINARSWGYHSLGAGAGVDFAYLQFADQVGVELPSGATARPNVTWMRLLTDAPVAVLEMAAGRLSFRDYLRALRLRDVEAVFDLTDFLPGMAEVAMVPYLMVKRGF